MRSSIAFVIFGCLALACAPEASDEAEHGHTHGPRGEHQHQGKILPAPAIVFAREHNPNFDEVLAGGN